ncbi:pancreatic lipase-related protein 2-like [Hydractinia symbiolongicarpus]|uniref:pancreatic lipase-related protein 2-like n=1 Tax=Hydractinia symbiolongicarpus TaxID=13093 RepID=UPI002549CF60|nr:pancreatic lipase-related protein 2-like [Hydractinia symbiolongicarpus]
MRMLLILLGFALTQAHQICYHPYGCFSDAPPFDYPLVQLPEDPKVLNTKFSLFTRLNKDEGQPLDPLDHAPTNNSNFDGTKKTVIIVHGYIGNSGEYWVQPLVDALLKREQMNVVVVDWKKGAAFPYHQAVGNARIIGAQVALLLKGLQEQTRLDLMNVHCIGFSMGAHVCGFVGRNFARSNVTIGRISGLDPSAPYYEFRHADVRLDKTDADFVDVIHTDTKTLLVKGFGTAQELGHLDFYPNGGHDQPNCRNLDNGVTQYLTCSHYRAIEYFTESINIQNCPSRGYPCKDYQTFAKGLCTKCTTCPRMGYSAVEYKDSATGVYYLQTAGKKPFCAHHYNIAFYTESQIAGDLDDEVDVIITGEKAVSEKITIPSHYYKSGSIDSFLIHTRFDLGKPEKIKVQHGAWLDMWKLQAVVLRPMWNDKVYTGCYKRWLNTAKNEVPLKTGQAAYCP